VHVVVVLDEAETTTVCGRAVALAKFSGAVEVERDIADRVGVFRRAEALGRALGAPSRVSGARGVHSYAARRRQTNSQKKHHNDDDDPLIKKRTATAKSERPKHFTSWRTETARCCVLVYLGRVRVATGRVRYLRVVKNISFCDLIFVVQVLDLFILFTTISLFIIVWSFSFA